MAARGQRRFDISPPLDSSSSGLCPSLSSANAKLFARPFKRPREGEEEIGQVTLQKNENSHFLEHKLHSSFPDL